MYILNIANTIKKVAINELRYFTFQKYYRRIWFSKRNSCNLIKHQKKKIQFFETNSTKKIPDPRTAQEHYQTLSIIYKIEKYKISKPIKTDY